jgi:hypothetical protein
LTVEDGSMLLLESGGRHVGEERTDGEGGMEERGRDDMDI